MPDVRDMKSVWAGYGLEELPLKRCPNCGVETRTQLARCPECDRRYDRRLPWLTDMMRWGLGVAGVLALIAGCILILPGVFDERDAGNARRAAAQRALEASERQRMAREQIPVHGRGVAEPRRGSAAEKLAARATLLTTVEAAILTNARRRIAAGELKGEVVRVECGPLVRTPGRPPDHEVLSRPVGRYDCVAVQQDVVRSGQKVGLFGHPFVAALTFARGTYTFCKDNKAPSERGKPLAQVRLAPECLGLPPDAEVLGNGYVMPEDG
jgi:hypothetical protein